MSDCEQRDEHCWHETPWPAALPREIFEAICCHCGARNSALDRLTALGHGPHVPRPPIDVLDVLSGRSDWQDSGTFDADAYQARLAELQAEQMELQQPGITKALASARNYLKALETDDKS